MQKTDFFYFWMSSAISRPDNSPKKFYYDSKNEVLFAFKEIDGKRVPSLRNDTLSWEINEKRYKGVESKILDLSLKWVFEIPRIPTSEKELFIANYKLNHPTLPSDIFDDTENKGYFINGTVHQKMKKISFGTQWFFDEGAFLVSWMEILVFPLGISEDTIILG